MITIKSSCYASYVLTALLALLIFFSAAGKVYAANGEDGSIEKDHQTETVEDSSRAWIAMAAAVTMAFSCLAAGYAVAKVGAAAMGAASEKPEIMGKAMLFVAIAEGIAIYGLIIAVFLLTKI